MPVNNLNDPQVVALSAIILLAICLATLIAALLVDRAYQKRIEKDIDRLLASLYTLLENAKDDAHEQDQDTHGHDQTRE